MENESKMSLPCMRDRCVGKACGNFGDKGCKGGAYPPWSYARWYLEELPKIAQAHALEGKTGETT